MPRRHKVRHTDSIQNEFRQLKKQVSRKKSYLKTTYGIETPDFKSQLKDFEYKTELTAFKNQMKQFLNRNFNREKTHYRTKDNALIPIKEVKELKKELKRINEQKKIEREKVEDLQVYHKGKLRGTVKEVQGAGDDRLDRFTPLVFNLNRFKSVKQFEKYKENIKQVFEGDFIQKQDEIYRESYIKSLKNKFGLSDELENDLDRILNKVSSMPIEEYMQFYYTRTFTKLSFIYDKLDARKKLNQILADWDIAEGE